ncbi:HYR domain-containing protein, partial [Psychroserpens sp. AS72]|uniref:HYR domain-containing protein n=1 Tax=Psychroserpens sp. AS72 TaxID=3135775 RepID=UPI00317844C5
MKRLLLSLENYLSFIFSNVFFIKRKLLIISIFSLGSIAYTQCPDDNIQFDTSTPNCTGAPETLTTCIYGGEYRAVNVIAGNTYTFETCGDTNFDTQLTVYGAGGNVLGYNDDFCGLQSSVTFVAGVSEQVRVLINEYNCVSNSSCMTLISTCTPPICIPPTATGVEICAGENSQALTTNEVCPSGTVPGTLTATGAGGVSGRSSGTFSDQYTTFNNTNININFPALPAGAIVTGTSLTISYTSINGSYRSELRVQANPPNGQPQQNNIQPSTFNSQGPVSNATLGSWGTNNPSGNWNFKFRETYNDNGTNADANISNITITVTYDLPVPGNIEWYQNATGGSSIASGASFDPIAFLPGGNTDTPGTYTFYAACSATPDCRTAVDYTIKETIDYANLQSPGSETMCLNDTLTAYGQVYEAGLTDSNSSAVSDISVEFGVNESDVDPSTWPAGNWDTAIPNPTYDFNQNNDEYQYEFTPNTVGTYYYTFRYSLNGCEWQYGGHPNGFWNGSSQKNGSLTVQENHTLSLSLGSTNQTLCPNTTIEDIVYTFDGGASSTSISPALPTGLTFNPSTATISGTPTNSGTYNYTISTVGNSCSSEQLSGTITVKELLDYANLQSPESETLCLSETLTAYGQVYESGLTDSSGSAASGISVEFGFNGSDVDPSTWPAGNWDTAIPNPTYDFNQNNDEYQYEFTPNTVGTYYYTFRYSLDGCEWQYGGHPNGFWNGSSQNNGSLTVNEAPVITSSFSNITQNTDSGVCGAIVTYDDVVATGTPTPTINYSHLSGSLFPVGTTLVTVTVTNSCGSESKTFEITVIDNEIPVINGTPANITVSNDPGKCDAIVTWTPATVADNCPGATISSDLPSGHTFSLGTTTVNYTASDAAGNNAEATSFTVTVEDNEIPVINGTPENITVSNDPGNCDAVVTWTPATVTDNCPGATISSDLPSGHTFPLGTTTVNYTAVDAAGNNAVATSFTVTVEDNENPVISCITDDARDTDAGECTYTIQGTEFDATFTDNCTDGSITNDYNNNASLAGAVFQKGATTVTWTVNDGHGQTAICTTTITVEDNEDPTITCAGDITQDSDLGSCDAIVTYSVTSSDNCAGESLVQTAGLASGSTFPLGTTTNTFEVT